MSTASTADRLLAKKFGVFTHFLKHDRPEGWSATVDGFDVPALAKTLKDVGAGWYFITLLQGRKFMCAPNAEFDRVAGTAPGEACSRRDLPADISAALAPLGIDLCLYFTGDGPYKDVPIGERFGYLRPRDGEGFGSADINRPFVEKWSRVLEEYAVRYGDRVSAWWIDGCYAEYFHYTDELVKLYANACHKGNPDALVALNDGVKPAFTRDFPSEDMTCGEFNDFTVLPDGRYIDGAQAHVLAPIGRPVTSEWDCWCRPGCKRDAAYMADYVKKANERGCLVTIDVCIDERGHIDPEQAQLLADMSARL